MIYNLNELKRVWKWRGQRYGRYLKKTVARNGGQLRLRSSEFGKRVFLYSQGYSLGRTAGGVGHLERINQQKKRPRPNVRWLRGERKRIEGADST